MSLKGVLMRGYLGLRTLFKVFGLWNVTEVLTFLHFFFNGAANFTAFAAFTTFDFWEAESQLRHRWRQSTSAFVKSICQKIPRRRISEWGKMDPINVLREGEMHNEEMIKNVARQEDPLRDELMTGGCETGEHQVDAIRLQSEKELVKEIEKAVVLLTPDQDWSIRIAAMQRIEGLVSGDGMVIADTVGGEDDSLGSEVGVLSMELLESVLRNMQALIHS